MINEYIPFAFRIVFSSDMEDAFWSVLARSMAEKIDSEITNKDAEEESLD